MQPADRTTADVFERWAWLYSLCRERLFTDHTELVAKLMEERRGLETTPVFVELGCGPGFYSVGVAKRFPHWQVMGIDHSTRLLQRATERVQSSGLSNCRFALGDATQPLPAQADFLFASRLLFILSDRLSAVLAMHDDLRPGGTLLIVEPRPGWRSRLALLGMSALRGLGRERCASGSSAGTLRAVSGVELSGLVGGLNFQDVRFWSDARYHYVLCTRSPVEVALTDEFVDETAVSSINPTIRRQVA